MRSVQSELISKAFTEMCATGDDASCDGSKVSSSRLLADPASSSLNFGDGNCGEAPAAQRLQLDFTLDDALDTEASQEKCCAFWDLVGNTPEMQGAMVQPDAEVTRLLEEPVHHQEAASSSSREGSGGSGRCRTAVSMLSLAQKKGYIKPTFDVKITKSKCSIGCRNYLHVDENKRHSRKQHDCNCCRCSEGPSTTDVNSVLAEMDKFDKDHPKVMDPPGHNPDLKHCILQRKVDITPY